MTTGALREEEVVVIAILDHVRRFLRVSARRLESKLTLGARRLERRVVHADLVQIAPEGSEVHLVVVSILENLAVDCVVIVTRAR